MDAVHEHTLRQEHSKRADGKSKDSSGKVPGASDNGKALLASNDYIVVAAGAVDDQNVSVLVNPTHDAHMGMIRVKHQVTGLCGRPRNIGAIAVLCGGPAAMADDVAAACGIVKNPIDES